METNIPDLYSAFKRFNKTAFKVACVFADILLYYLLLKYVNSVCKYLDVNVTRN